MKLFSQPKLLNSLIVALLGGSLLACTPNKPAETAKPATEQTEPAATNDAAIDGEMMPANGPKADAKRAIAKPIVSTSDDGSTTIVSVDFGNVTDKEFAAPMRGLIISPTKAEAPTPLIIVSHLRAPNCADRSFAYPCADGVEEFRYDLGMQYFGEYLAKLGYTVVIPDLGGIYIGDDTNSPYNQHTMWETTVSRFLDSLKNSDNQERTLGKTLAPVDFTKVGLFVHSRSGMMTESAQKVVGKDNLRGILAYGPAYDTVELEYITPAPADVPYLALVGSLDADVGPSANLWLGHYTTTPRQHPASALELPGFGHMYINRAASQAQFDDRIGCDELDCPDAKAHETILKQLAKDWFGATLRQETSGLPLLASDPLSDKLEAMPARWLALTPKAIGFVSAKDFGESDTVKQCAHVDPMNPKPSNTPCPDAENGVVQILTPVAYLSNTGTAKTQIQGAKGLSLHIAPTDSRPNVAGTAVTLTLTLANGKTETLEIPASHPALISRQTEHENGTYRLGTVRLNLPQTVADSTITAITIMADHPVQVRSVDFW